MSLSPEQAEDPHFLHHIFAALTLLAPFLLMCHSRCQWLHLTYPFYHKAHLGSLPPRLCWPALMTRSSSRDVAPVLYPMKPRQPKCSVITRVKYSSFRARENSVKWCSVMSQSEMWVLVSKNIILYAETKLTNFYLVHERKKERVAPRSPSQ